MKQLLLIAFAVCSCFSFKGYAQISGTITDAENNTPLPGVSIVVVGKSIGATSDFDGHYTIQAVPGDELKFSYIGMTTVTLTVGNDEVVNVAMKEDATQLGEVVVTAFGMEKQTKSLGYSVQRVEAADLDLTGRTNALEALQGRVAGLQINKTSGSAGGGVDILIRGVTSVNPGRDNQPLIIVDGVALNNDTFSGNVSPSAGSNATNSSEQFAFSNRAGDINPEDIESFNVLKGAAATALYGIRASNGAIVITTKRGKKGKLKVGLAASTSVREVRKTPELQKIYREGSPTNMAPGAVINPDAEGGYDRYGTAFWTWGVPYTEDSYTFSDGTVADLSNDRFYNPFDLFRTGVNTQVNLNLSGASDKTDYYFSMGNSRDKGILPGTDYEKTNFRLKSGYQITDNLKISSSIAYTRSGGSRGNGGDKSIFSSLAYWPLSFNINDYKYPDGSQKNPTNGIIDNPRYFAETSNLRDKVNRWVGNAIVNWSPASWLSLTYSAQVDNYSDVRNRFVPSDLDVGTQVGGFIVQENINFTGLESNFLATMTHDITDDLKGTLTLGHQVSDLKTDYAFIRGEGLNVPGINNIDNTSNIFTGTNITHLRNMGIFGDFRLDYKDRVFLSVTGRNDWISAMPQANRSFFYPSASLSYLFNDLIDPAKETFSFGKVRVSWAQVGKGPNFGQVGSYFVKDPDFPFGGASGYRARTIYGDENLVPEKNNTFELGGDLRFLNNRIRLDYTYYKTNVKNQIFPVSTAYSSGLSSVVRNAGDYETWGHEMLLIASVFDEETFKWEATVNWSTTGSKVTAIPEDVGEIVFFEDIITAQSKIGDPVGALYGWKFRTTPDGERYVNADGKWVVTGSENNGYYYEGGNRQVKVGNAFPDYILSFGSNFKWKNIGLNFLVEYKAGGDLYDRGFRNALRNGLLKETEFRNQNTVLQGMTDDGSGGYVTNTREVLVDGNNFYRSAANYNYASEVLLEDGSWVKLRNINLSYQLAGSFVKKIGLERATLNASASNIIIWTPFKGFDPEGNQFSAGSNIYGFTGLVVPLTQSYSFGINVEF
ncbi:SusC/RagA family TonB-linked outer membrane protein [Sinomicrobium oceani]|uniref:SusC/RagA family TonB-linked outer membrane protein n=1 Tax=Sinomicrobium oceani TaxID=1150368 RepID=UPI00227B6F3F|nr:SusC/RagA family TonB-linked outer membrane protein [Sinomicrobium oceani]